MFLRPKLPRVAANDRQVCPRYIYQQVYLPELLERVSAGKRGRRIATYRSE